jgi:predicted ArsR family transcriptional regulator
VPDPDPIDHRAHRVLAGASRVRVLEKLRARGTAVTAPELAEQLGLHPNTVRLHLDQLAGAGLVTARPEPRPGPGRPRLLYSAVASPAPPTEEEGYRTLAGILADHIEATAAQPAEEAAGVGRAWARSLAGTAPAAQVPPDPDAATEHLVRLMDGLGFAPSATGAGGPIELHRCPFRQVAEQHSRVVCGVHLGLMQGALDEISAPLRATRLEPFVRPGLCLAHLAPDTTVEDVAPPIQQATGGIPS